MKVPRYESKEYFSKGFQNFINVIWPYQGIKEAVYPPKCSETHISKNEEIHEWFKRIVDDHLGRDTSQCAMETGMAVFASLRFNDNIIEYANIQVLKTKPDKKLVDYYRHPDKVSCKYLRFDYDLKCLGEMFTHPHPHIHTTPDGSPRFWSTIYHNGNVSENIVLDFFEFVYRNFYPEKWHDWARYACQSKRPIIQEDDVKFDAIIEAFKANNQEAILSKYNRDLKRIKSRCRELKEKLFPFTMESERANGFTYEIL